MLDLQPTLTGETLRLRPLRQEDREVLYDVAKDPLIWEQHPNSDRWQRPQFDAFFDNAMTSGGAFAVEDGQGRVVGSTRYQLDQGDNSVQIGWTFLERALWGGPANREMKQLLLDHALTAVDRVVFEVGPDNHRSQRALAKLGARLVGERNTPDRGRRLVFEITPADQP